MLPKEIGSISLPFGNIIVPPTLIIEDDYDQSRQVLVQALNAHFGERATILGEQAGIHLMVRLDTHISDEEIIQRAAQVDVGMISAQPYYLKACHRGEFIFGYSELTQQQLQEGVRRLAQVLKDSGKW
jgi:GntR family transcriptional regulator / MocR family aminotransferase